MDREDKKKMWIMIIVLVLLIILSFILPKIKKETPDEAVQEEVTETEASEEVSEETPASTEQNINAHIADGETYESIIDSLEAMNDEESYFDLHEDTAGGILGNASLGNMHITYQTEDAKTGSGKVIGKGINAIWFHDGNEEDMKGSIFTMNAFGPFSDRPETENDARYLLSEYIPDGVGVEAEWENDLNYFVRKVTGYSDSMGGAYISYTVVPKETSDSNIYNAMVSLSGNEFNPEPLKRSSYESIMTGLQELVPDSEYFNQPYEDTVRELTKVNFYETATGDSMGGIQQLKAAENEYYITTYGVSLDGSTEKTWNDLTEEEKADMKWQSEDPVGYAQYHEMERKDKELQERLDAEEALERALEEADQSEKNEDEN